MTSHILFADFETASHADLTVSGLARYLADPSTRAYCLAFRLPGMSSTDLWESGKPLPAQLRLHVAGGGTFVAHNAQFDAEIWNEILSREFPDLPRLRDEQIQCSAVRARYNGLPGSLEMACQAMGLPIQKDTEGGAIMKQIMFHPEWSPKTHPAEFARIFKYAVTDVDAMIGLWEATQPITPKHQKQYEMDLRINRRGFGADVEAARGMEELRELAEVELDYRMTLLTNGGVLHVSEVAKLKAALAALGEEIGDADRESLKAIANKPGVSDDVKALVELRLDASRAPKKAAAILRAEVDGRMRYSTVFMGALSGRSTARGCGNVQLLNVARPRPGFSAEQCEEFCAAAKRRDLAYLARPEHGPVLAALADAQRSLFRSGRDDCTLVDADSSGIEARFAPWLAGDEEKLSDFEKGIDSYKKSAMTIFVGLAYEEISKDQRQIGKVADLALGFGGGDGAFVSMAANYGVHLPPEQVSEIVFNWRAGRPMFGRWWSMCEYSILMALDQPGREIAMPAGRDQQSSIVFVRDDRALRMRMPAGNTISYHNARLHLEPCASAPIAVYDKPEGYVETLDRKIVSNNQTQNAAREFFWEVLQDVDRVEQIVHHVYDQIVMEVPRERAAQRLAQLIERFKMTPKWAPGLPLDAAGYINDQWRKD